MPHTSNCEPAGFNFCPKRTRTRATGWYFLVTAMATSSISSNAPSPSHKPKGGVLRRVFKAFEYRDFRIMWLGACTSTIGTFMQTLAQAWLVLELTKSAFYLGLDAFLSQIPIVLFSLIGGVVADRTERRNLLLFSQVVQMICAF